MIISVSETKLQRAEAALQHIQGGYVRAVSSAVNRSLESLRTVTVKETTEKYFVKPKEVRQTLTLKRASGANLYGELISRGARKSLSKYMIEPKRPPVAPESFRAAVKKAGGLKPIPLAFLIPRSGNVLVAIRDAPGGGGLRMLRSLSIPQLVKNKDTVAEAEKKANETFEKRLDHETMRLLKLLP